MKRMVIAAISLVGIIVATYLTLYKLGYIGELSCSVGSCETVNLSRWAFLLGAPVAAWGVAFYITTFVVAICSVQPRFAEDRRLSLALTVLAGWGFLFSGWLTYLDLFVIHAICIWCVTSAVLVTIMIGVSLWDLFSRPTGGAAMPAEAGP
jgi:uncharacterized membrane protein